MAEECMAVAEGAYGFGDKRFTGMIMYGENEAYVENARFYLKRLNGKRCIGFVDGTWVDGTFSDGIFSDGTWKNGTFKGGIWHNGIWQDGKWVRGIWQDGVWMKGEGDRFSKDNTSYHVDY